MSCLRIIRASIARVPWLVRGLFGVLTILAALLYWVEPPLTPLAFLVLISLARGHRLTRCTVAAASLIASMFVGFSLLILFAHGYLSAMPLVEGALTIGGFITAFIPLGTAMWILGDNRLWEWTARPTPPPLF